MRVTRNYRNGMVNFRKNHNKSEVESLVNTLRLNSAKRRSNTLSSILGGSSKSASASGRFDTNRLFDRNTVTSTEKPQKFYYDMQYHAKQVGEYADALQSSTKDSKEESIYDKAKKSGSTEEIVSNIKSFVNQYNNMLEDLEESGSRSDTILRTQFDTLARAAEKDLAATGVTKRADGTLEIDEKKLEAADVETLEKVWGGSGFSLKAGAKAGTVEATAERNIEAEKSSTYSPFNRTNLYGNSTRSSGNYFNYRR